MTANLRDRIEQAKATPVRKGRRKAEWEPLTLTELVRRDVLAFDQTNTKTGWVRLVWPNGFIEHPTVVRRGVLREPPYEQFTGHEGTLRRSANMCDRIAEVIRQESTAYAWDGLMIVHEMPAVHGMRLESSLMAALGIRLACNDQDLPFWGVHTQHAKQVLTGNRIAEKREVKEALHKLLPEDAFVSASEQRWNLDQYDALSLAIIYLADHKKGEAP